MSFDTYDTPETPGAKKRRETHSRGIKWMREGRPSGDAEAALAAIPPDTRTLTGKLMGDPLPLDTRRRQ